MPVAPRMDPREKIKGQLKMAASPADEAWEKASEEEYRRKQSERIDPYAGMRANEAELARKAKALVQSVMPKVDTGKATQIGREAGEESAAVARLRANRLKIQEQRAAKKPEKEKEFVGDVPVAYSTRWASEKKPKRTGPDYASMPKLSHEHAAEGLAHALKSVPRGSYDSPESFMRDLSHLGHSVLSNAPQTRDLSDEDKEKITEAALQRLKSDPNYGPKGDTPEEQAARAARKKKKDEMAGKRAQRTAKSDLVKAVGELTGKPVRKHRAKQKIDYASWETPGSTVYRGRKLAYAKALKRAKATGDFSKADALGAASNLKPETMRRIKDHVVKGVLPGSRRKKGGVAAPKTSKNRAILISKLQKQAYSAEEAAAMADEFIASGVKPKKPAEPKPFAKTGEYKFKKGR